MIIENILSFINRMRGIATINVEASKIAIGGGYLEEHELETKIKEVSKSILSYCMSKTSTQHDAEDLAQDMVCELIKSAQNIRDERAFYGFMWSVVNNVYKQWYRKKQRINECELTDEL